MMLYEVKLMNPETKEIYFIETSEKPKLPSQEIIDRYYGAVIVIRTLEIIR